jgi:hypothetical protein
VIYIVKGHFSHNSVFQNHLSRNSLYAISWFEKPKRFLKYQIKFAKHEEKQATETVLVVLLNVLSHIRADYRRSVDW